MALTIRSAGLNDLPTLLAIERDSASAAHWTDEQYQRRMVEGVILVAEDAGAILGFVVARVVSGEWEIENVVVAEKARRRGVADGLFSEFLLRVREKPGAVIWLEVRESNDPARRLYKKHGFRETGRRRGYYRNPVEDAVLYELRLAIS